MINPWSESKSWDSEWKTISNIDGGAQCSAKIVEHKSGDIRAFIKILNRQDIIERRSRFFREASAYDTLNSPGVPRLIQSNSHHHADTDYKLFIALDYIEGESLAEHIKNNGSASIFNALEFTKKLLTIIKDVHSHDWVHRDIKPDNIVLRNKNILDPILVDFGIGFSQAFTGNHQTIDGQEVGNRFLRLPELMSGSPAKHDIRSDLSFVGGLLFYILTEKEPTVLIDSDGKMPHQNSEALMKLSQKTDGRVTPICDLFDRVFLPKITNRFHSASSMLDAINDLQTKIEGGGMSKNNDDLRLILDAINSKESIRQLEQNNVFTGIMQEIQKVHMGLAKKIGSVLQSTQSGHKASPNEFKNRLGFKHISDPAKKFIPEFRILSAGDEIVVKMDEKTILRVDAESPAIDQAFKERLEKEYLRGIRIYIAGSKYIANLSSCFIGQTPQDLVGASADSKKENKPLFIFAYDDLDPEMSKIEYAAGYFMEYSETKSLIDNYFIPVVCAWTEIVTAGYSQETKINSAKWIVVDANNTVLRDEDIYANASEGLKRVKKVLIDIGGL